MRYQTKRFLIDTGWVLVIVFIFAVGMTDPIIFDRIVEFVR
jgi:hypothetical protein